MNDNPVIFISYAREDSDWFRALWSQLSVLRQSGVKLWADRELEIGDDWPSKIEAAMAEADLAVLLVSSDFFESDFIRTAELPRLLERKESDGLVIVPLVLKACAWGTVGWMHRTNKFPDGDVKFDDKGEPTSQPVKDLMAEAVRRIDKLLKDRMSRPIGAAESAAGLIVRVLLQDLDDKAQTSLAQQLVALIGKISDMKGGALFHAVRSFVEYHLLRSDEPCSPRDLLASLATAEAIKPLWSELKRTTGDFAQIVIEVDQLFFGRAREREESWKAYFKALPALGFDVAAADNASLCRIKVESGYVAPQFLIAGLMSHFNDDWKPVLEAYQQAARSQRGSTGAFQSLQATQWNCWLVWGPSIPLCRCEQWADKFAYQYGYGDENNSLPLLEMDADAEGRPRTIDPLVAELARDGRLARPVGVTGRLRWGPDFLKAVDDNDEPHGRRHVMATAQAITYAREGRDNTQHSDGLILQLESIDNTPEDNRTYFSAYLWLMFLVAGPAGGSSDDGPDLLRSKAYPEWSDDPADRVFVREERLWANLLPSFVHANFADPVAFRIQSRMLIDNSVALLRQVWAARSEFFDRADVERGICFHLVCASDYSGCGKQVLYPPKESLASLLRNQLASEADRDFARSVVVPDDGAPADKRPWGLACYFSSCHLPELVADHFEFVADVDKRRRAGAKRKR